MPTILSIVLNHKYFAFMNFQISAFQSEITTVKNAKTQFSVEYHMKYNLCSVICIWSEHQDNIMRTFGKGESARDSILSTLGSVQYFRGYHECIGGFHYFVVFKIN